MIGILFATEMEALPFRASSSADSVVIAISGMGLAAAHFATRELIEKHGVELVINAGVCGALDDDLSRGDLFLIEETFGEVDVAGCRVAPVQSVDRMFPTKKLVSVNKPVFQSCRKATLAKLGDLVDMEGHAVAQVCAEKKIPCILFKGVTDFGDIDGKADIKKHMASVAEKMAAELQRMIQPTIESSKHSVFESLHSFTKIEHTIFSLPLLFAGAWLGAGGLPSFKSLGLIALVGMGARTFGMAMNRILDRKMDAKNSRTKSREIPAGKLSVLQGYGVAAAGLGCYFLGCALLGATVFKLSWLPLIPLSIYSLLKRFTPLCHYGIGICLAAAPMGAFVAVTNSLVFPAPVWLLALFTFCWISGFDIIYALQDIEFDRANNVRSIPAAFGIKGAWLIAALTHVIAVMALLFLIAGFWSSIAAVFSVAAFVAGYLPRIPLPIRFFPISAIAGIAGACVVLLRVMG